MRSGYAATFYPAASEVAFAQAVTVVNEQIVSDINIGLTNARSARISGVAVDPQGQPATAGSVEAIPRQTTPSTGIVAGLLAADGTFTIRNVPPGQYVLRARVFDHSLAGTAASFVSVNGEDVTDVRLIPLAPVTIKGHVRFAEPETASLLNPSSITLTIHAWTQEDATDLFAQAPVSVNDDFTFELMTIPGRVGISTAVPSVVGKSGQPISWRTKAIRSNGVDLTDFGIEANTESVIGIEIELTTRTQQVEGAVIDPRGNSVAEFVVLLFAQDRARRVIADNRYFAIGYPGDDGHYRVASLAPGVYYAIAVNRADVDS